MGNNQYISPEKIRLYLLDRSAGDNLLLDDVDFSNELLDLAQELVLDRYNTTDPFIEVRHTVEDFPYKVEFLMGVTAQLLRSKGINMKRNQLNYSSASGTAVDDKKQADEYLAMSAQMFQEFDSRVRKIKCHININEGYGAQGSSYADISGFWPL